MLAAIVGVASSPSDVATFSAAGLTVTGASSGVSLVIVVPSMVSSRTTAGVVGDSKTTGVAAVSSTVGGGSATVAVSSTGAAWVGVAGDCSVGVSLVCVEGASIER